MNQHLNNRFAVGITLEVVAGNEQLAIKTAQDAAQVLKSDRIVHGWINRQAEPLFDTAAFEQIKGQISMDRSAWRDQR